jgi:NRPS condensation-like uncharacterized protein
MTQLSLPLTNFEEYMLADDYAGHPLTIAARLRFRGQVSESAATQAVQLLIKRHPLLHCLVQSRGRRKAWTSSPDPIHPPRFLKQEPSSSLPALRRFNLFHEVGGDCTFLQGEEKCDMIIQGHHACVDGVGALQLIHDWLQFYHEAVGGGEEVARLPRLDARLLKGRGDFGFRRWSYLKKLPKQALGLYGIHEFLNHQAVSLAASNATDVDSTATGFHGVETITWDQETFGKHLALSDQWSIRANELLLAALFKSLSQWRRERSLGDQDDWLRVMVPFNMREFKHRKMSAANRVSFVSVDRKARPFHRFAEFAKGIHGQMDVIHSHELGLTFQAFLKLQSMLPGGVARLAREDYCGATAILTNLGKPLRRTGLPQRDGKLCPGNLVLEELELLPPLRPHTHISFAVFRYAGRQQITACFDQRKLTREDARELLKGLTEYASQPPS